MTEATIKEKVWSLLDKNPLLLPKQICRILGLNYSYYKNYITKLRSIWRGLPKIDRGLKPSSVHGWHGWLYVPECLDRRKHVDVTGRAVGCGWLLTKSKNHYLLWKDRKLGRLEWHLTGRVRVWIRKPASIGKGKQLLANAFIQTGLLFDSRVWQPFIDSLRFKGAHYVFRTKERLPKMTINLFADSNGFIIKTGDRTHPDSIEIIAAYPDWGERAESATIRLIKILEKLITKPDDKTVRPEPDKPYWV